MERARMGRRAAAVFFACATATLGASSTAHAAAASCTFDAFGQKVSIVGDGAGPVEVTIDAGSGLIHAGATSCGMATTDNTTVIEVDANRRTAALRFSAQPIGPSGEVRTIVSDSTYLTYEDLSAAATTAQVGRSGAARAIDVNGDGDGDVIQTEASRLALVALGDGDDTLSSSGIPGAGATRDDGVSLDGQGGADRLAGPGLLLGGPGDDTYTIAPAGLTLLDYSAATEAVQMLADNTGTADGGDGYGGTDAYVGFDGTTAYDVMGGPFADVLRGGLGRNRLWGNAGDDTVDGGPGDDIVDGGLGGDTLRGGDGADTVAANDGPVTFGDDASNSVSGGAGGDTLYDALGDDTFPGLQDGEVDTVRCSSGNDSAAPDRVDSLNGPCDFRSNVPAVSIGPASASGGSPVRFTVSISPAPEHAASVRLTTSDGSAVAGQDYQGTQQTVTLEPGMTSTTVDIPTADNGVDDGTRTFTATLDQPSETPRLGTPTTATATILDDEVPVMGVGLEPASPPTDGVYATPPSVIVSPPANATATRCAIDPIDTPGDFTALPDGACAYAVAGGAKLRSGGAHRLCAASTTTTDDTAVTCVSWETAAPAVSLIEDATGREGATLTFTLGLTWSPSPAPSVTFATVDGTAKAGRDFTAVTRQITFGDGELSRTIGVATLDNAGDEATRTFAARLSDASAGLALGAETRAGSITDDDAPRIGVALDPPSADGAYTASPTVRVTPPALAAETRCVTDPATRPATFAAMTAGDCPYVSGATVAGAGSHVVCAASRTSTPEDTEVVCTAFTVRDSTPNPAPAPAPQDEPEPSPLPTCLGRTATIVLRPGDATATGTPGRDVIVGTAGADRIRGGGGNDVICGGAGDDRIFGGGGDDKIFGGGGQDRISGNAGRDTLVGGGARDALYGGSGRDFVRIAGGRGNRARDFANCGSGRDVFKRDGIDRTTRCEIRRR